MHNNKQLAIRRRRKKPHSSS